MKYAHIVVAGAELKASLDAERAKLPMQYGCYRSEELCAWQRKVSARGICEVEIVETLYGYSVRYASGLNNFAILKGSRGAADPSLEAAEQFCRDWVAQAPKSRFATRTVQVEEVA